MPNAKLNKAASLALFDLQRYKDIISKDAFGRDYPKNLMEVVNLIRTTYSRKFTDLCAALNFSFTEAEIVEKLKWHVDKFELDLTDYELKTGQILNKSNKITSLLS